MQFADTFPDEKIVVSLVRQLSWIHILAIIPIEDPIKKEFYIEICKLKKWSVRTLSERFQPKTLTNILAMIGSHNGRYQ